MKLLSPQQIHDWDAYTIASEPIASIDLMQRAARKCTDFIIEENFIKAGIKIFCGKGNNGGDGLAIARQLIEAGYTPLVYILEFGAKGTDDFQANLHWLHQLTTDIHFIQSKDFFPVIENDDVVIDALYGSGLNRPLQNLSEELVQHINKSDTTVISIDVPSGMFIDKSSRGNTVINADHTLTFQSLKLCFLVAENAEPVGQVHVLDIGLHAAFLQNTNTVLELVEKEQISSYLKPRKPFSHKGTYGHSLLIAGNKGKMGAAILAARACLRSGTGLLTVSVPEHGLNILQTAVPEAMCAIRGDAIDYSKFSAIGVGPGLGTAEESKELLKNLLANYSKPMVLDADALNILSNNKDMLATIPGGSVLTPHPKEFERLAGAAENDFEGIQLALQLSQQYPFVVVLKGHYTLTAYAGKGYFNTTGNPGMAKGGSGDILTGILTALLAQGYNPVQATLLGVYIHGLAAGHALMNQSPESMTATDITENLGAAFYSLAEGPSA